MALDIKTFNTRAISAVFFAIIMLGAFLGPELLFFTLFAIITVIGLLEFKKIIEKIIGVQFSKINSQLFGAIGVLIFIIFYFANNHLLKIGETNFSTNNTFYLISIFSVVVFIFLGKLKNQLILVNGWIYISVSFGLLGQLHHLNSLLPLIVLLLIWTNDTMQYIVGSLIGKTPMAPIISPKKTWEGTIGGSACAVLVAVIWGLFCHQFALIHWLAIGLIVVTTGTLGDLVESKLKRTAGVKDSGNIMPGHGGILDRFDSILIAAPIVWLYAIMFMT